LTQKCASLTDTSVMTMAPPHELNLRNRALFDVGHAVEDHEGIIERVLKLQ